jgi:hypothetical protein
MASIQPPERVPEAAASIQQNKPATQKRPLFTRRLVLRIFAGLLIVYVCFGTYVWWAMHQPPEIFGQVMAKMPGPVPFLLFPFETAWMHARAGSLHNGDAAPDFSLVKLDKTDRIRLSAFAEQRRPVVLIFGSYT